MTRQEQREQKLQLELANADRKAQEAKNRELTFEARSIEVRNATIARIY